MSGRKAKLIRRGVYRLQSLRAARKYFRLKSGQIINDPTGLRAQYQRVKGWM